MKLNHDCVREVMLAIEDIDIAEIPFGTDNYYLYEDRKLVEKYSKEDILYSLIQLTDAQYIDGSVEGYGDGETGVTFSKTTWKGHEYLDTVRDPKVWKQTKAATSKLASVSIDIVTQVATNVSLKLLGIDS
ncbi:DUF2513 domain-containing protein [Carnobacterium maltaromaticum]|uniref:DUF2513 domain-containing protein n=1 Tax=Carnobacterium maltaromaticum TaxID=2751 RepID=UPI0039BE7733